MTRNVEFYVNRANEKFEAGFTTMASKNDALQDLGRAYEMLTESIKALYLAIPYADRTEAQNDVYWGLANYLNNWKAKHTALVLNVFPQAEVFTSQIETLVEVRNTIKSAEIVKVERSANPRVETISKSVADIIALRKSQFERGVQLYDIFNGLPVTATWHYVTNQFGTSFIRVFYYMAGKLTPLNTIVAVLDAKSE
jgi:hypothetical protein